MHNLRSFYYRNKAKIWKIILVVILVLGIIYLLNSLVTDEHNQEILESEQHNVYNYNEEEIYIENSSAISGDNISEAEADKINETISKFIEYCQEQKYSEAYEMLSNECKEIRYTNLEKFTKQYANVRFSSNQVCNIQRWQGSTYKIEISEDFLATGNINNNEKILEYITIVEQNDTNKLNINEYVGRRTINKENTEKNINITVVSKEIYMDYEIYKMQIKNLSDKTIKLDSFEDTSSIYLKDKSGNTYKAFKNELLENELIINPGITFELEIKFANSYKIGTDIEKIIFEDVILNYDKYKKLQETEEFEDIGEIEVSL